LAPEHPRLHAAASAVHCATQAPDKPQFCAQEKLFESQLATHSAKVRDCASRIPSIEVVPLLAVAPNRIKTTTAIDLTASCSVTGVNHLRDSHGVGGLARSLRRGVGTRLDHAVGSGRKLGAGCCAGNKREQLGTKAVATGRSGGMQAEKRRHVRVLLDFGAFAPRGRMLARKQDRNTPLLVFKSELANSSAPRPRIVVASEIDHLNILCR
jgi:hypothetical protein